MKAKHPGVPDDVLVALRLACRDLPEANEETAWVGVRWRVRGKTFAHVLMVNDGWPPAYAKALKQGGPACVLTFESEAPSVDPETFTRYPFFKSPWRVNVVARVLDPDVDWNDIGELIKASYVMLAAAKFADHVRASRADD